MLKRLSDITVHHVSSLGNSGEHVDYLERRWWIALIALYSSTLASKADCDPTNASTNSTPSLAILCPKAVNKGHSKELYTMLIFLLAMLSRKRLYEEKYGTKYSRDRIRRMPLVSIIVQIIYYYIIIMYM
jgi:hypothetical protein